MKKMISLLVLTMLTISMSAQRPQPNRGGGRPPQGTQLQQKKNAIFLGVKAGVGINTMTQPDECNLYDGAGVGFGGGIVGKARFGTATEFAPAGTGLLGVGLELKYKQNTVKTIGTDESGAENANLSIGYFEVPVYVQLYPFYKTDAMNTFYIELGPDFAGTMSRSPKSLTVDNLSGDFSTVTYNLDNNGSKLKGFDVRVMAGIGYEIPIKNAKQETSSLVGINARYYLGTSKLAENFNCKMNTFEISLSWMFSIGKM